MKSVAKALREAFEEDRQRQTWELYNHIWRTYGVRAGDSFKAFVWWGWDYRIPSDHAPWCHCSLHEDRS